MSKTLESAIALGNDKKLLYKRLRKAVYTVSDRYRKTFAVGCSTYDFANKRLIGSTGCILQWQPCRHPDQPESYENQYTTTGSISLYI